MNSNQPFLDVKLVATNQNNSRSVSQTFRLYNKKYNRKTIPDSEETPSIQDNQTQPMVAEPQTTTRHSHTTSNKSKTISLLKT